MRYGLFPCFRITFDTVSSTFAAVSSIPQNKGQSALLHVLQRMPLGPALFAQAPDCAFMAVFRLFSRVRWCVFMAGNAADRLDP